MRRELVNTAASLIVVWLVELASHWELQPDKHEIHMSFPDIKVTNLNVHAAIAASAGGGAGAVAVVLRQALCACLCLLRARQKYQSNTFQSRSCDMG